MTKIKRTAYVSMLLALAIALNIAENMFIPEMPFGIRFGLANIISLITINLFSQKEMLLVNVLRVFIANLICGTIFGTRFFIGLGGIILSSISLLITNKLKCSTIFMSIVSAFLHTIGQILVVCFIYNTIYMLSAIPLYVISSIGTGILTGIIANLVLKRIKL